LVRSGFSIASLQIVAVAICFVEASRARTLSLEQPHRGAIGCRWKGFYTEIYAASTDIHALQPLSKKTFHMTSYRASPAKKIAEPSESKQVETALLPKEGEQVRREQQVVHEHVTCRCSISPCAWRLDAKPRPPLSLPLIPVPGQMTLLLLLPLSPDTISY
jgi:hypothetical protein